MTEHIYICAMVNKEVFTSSWKIVIGNVCEPVYACGQHKYHTINVNWNPEIFADCGR